jgi:hypothetical protein
VQLLSCLLFCPRRSSNSHDNFLPLSTPAKDEVQWVCASYQQLAHDSPRQFFNTHRNADVGISVTKIMLMGVGKSLDEASYDQTMLVDIKNPHGNDAEQQSKNISDALATPTIFEPKAMPMRAVVVSHCIWCRNRWDAILFLGCVSHSECG